MNTDNRTSNDSEAPLLSIIIATRNMAAQLEGCLTEILTASLPSHEILVFDGASEDRTREVLQKFGTHLAHWRSEPDKGVYDAFNKAVSLAKGQFFYFLGADDRLSTDLLALRNFLNCQTTMYYGDVLLEGTGKTYDGPFSRYKLARTNICQQAIFYPRSVFDRYRFSLAYPIQADWELNMRLAADPVYRLHYIPMQICRFASTGLSSTSEDKVFNQDYLDLIRKHFPRHIYICRWSLFNVLTLLKCALPKLLIDKLNNLSFRL
ncbi:glycosyltransferase [Desulfobulbus alkaliphilus]|uniref:glycosyltransferase n=1 Tax=Desulfobulbus alkaliphilus TaxID=869814 RepID=UPI001963F20F|nr:glycosyltransferase [Desulfobulbus alkaliphilus]